MKKFYLEGDVSWIQFMSKSPGEMDERNAWWMEQIPVLIQAKPSFIEVGIAHLMNGLDYKGLFSQLERLGYRIERIR